MTSDIEIRRFAGPADLARIERLVSAVVQECYGHLLQEDYRFDAGENWPGSWLAEAGGDLVGVLLTGRDWLDDLWIAPTHRRQGLGARLLAVAEGEISGRDHACGRLRVVAGNLFARQFYASHGWREDGRYPHETHGFEMVEMTKALGQGVDPKR